MVSPKTHEMGRKFWKKTRLRKPVLPLTYCQIFLAQLLNDLEIKPQ